jgi:acetyl esterase/lipase
MIILLSQKGDPMDNNDKLKLLSFSVLAVVVIVALVSILVPDKQPSKDLAGEAYRYARPTAEVHPAEVEYTETQRREEPSEEQLPPPPEEPAGDYLPPPSPNESQPPAQPTEVQLNSFKDINYANASGKKMLLDIHVPKDAEALLPTIIWLYPGGWKMGSKDQCMGKIFAQHGYAVACVNYRYSSDAIFPAQIHDVKAAVRWLRANALNYGLDSTNFGVAGASAGGHLAALLGTSGGVKELEGTANPGYSSKVKAVSDWFGPTEFFEISPTWSNESIPPHLINYSDYFGLATELIGQPNQAIKHDNKLAKLASPITHATSDDPPFLIMHGDLDDLIPPQQSLALQDALLTAGVDSTYIVVKGAGHLQGFTDDHFRDHVVPFFNKHLKP